MQCERGRSGTVKCGGNLLADVVAFADTTNQNLVADCDLLDHQIDGIAKVVPDVFTDSFEAGNIRTQ